jgi:hypothetical protein
VTVYFYYYYYYYYYLSGRTYALRGAPKGTTRLRVGTDNRELFLDVTLKDKSLQKPANEEDGSPKGHTQNLE